MKKEVGYHEAKTKLPELLRQVQAGKSFTITNRGKSIADLVPSASERSQTRSRRSSVFRHLFGRAGSRV